MNPKDRGPGAGNQRGRRPNQGPVRVGRPPITDPRSPSTYGTALGWLITLRFLLVALSLAIIVTRQAGRPLAALLSDPAAVLLLGCLPLNLLYWVLRHRGPAADGWVRVQTIVDLGVVSVLIYLTGGVASDLRFLYFAPLLSASALFGLAGGVLYASAATISVALMTLAHFFAFRYHLVLPLVLADWRPIFTQTTLRPQLLMLFGQAVSFYLVAALSGTLAARLRQVRILNEEILEHLVEGVLTIDRDARVVFLNRRGRELLRVPAGATVTGRPWQEVCPQHLTEPLDRALGRLLGLAPPGGPRPGRPGADRPPPAFGRFDFETELTPGGRQTPVPVQVASAPLADDRGRLRGVTVIFVDLSERKRMESALRQAERLEALNQAAAGIAHEIRNPIASIRASAQELLEQQDSKRSATPQTTGAGKPVGSTTSSTPDPRLLRLLMLESGRLNQIVSDFITYARLRSPAPATFPLAEVLERVVTLLEKQAQDHHQITCDCPPDLVVEADREQLVQVFLNLGLNGLEAMPEGGRLRFAGERRTGPGGQSRVVVSVSDEGPGVDPARRQRIFEPFFTTKAQGTGMGLPVVKRIVEAHGGWVTVGGSSGTGERGGGALFQVELPQHPGGTGEAPGARPPERAENVAERSGVSP